MDDLLMANKIPGFRTNRKRNKVIGIIGYSFFLIGILALLKSGQTPIDSLVYELTWVIVFLGLYIPIANPFNFRNKIFLLNRKSIRGKIFGYIGFFICCMIIIGIVNSLESDKEKAYQAADYAKRQEVKAVMAKVEEQKKADEDKQKQEAKAKADADTKAKAENDAKIKADKEAQAKLDQEANLKADAEAKTKKDAEDKVKAEAEAQAKKDADVKNKADAAAKIEDAKKSDPFSPQLKSNITSVARQGGLGDSFSQIEKVLGKATRVNIEMKDGIGQYNYQDDLEVVMYTEGRVQSIAYQLDSKKKSMKEKDALEFATKRVLPSDATFVKKIDLDNMERVYVYHSPSLEGLFSAEWFKDEEGNVHPGELGIDLMHDGDIVNAFSAAIGGQK